MDLNLEALEAGDNCSFYRQQRDYEAAQAARITWVVFAIILTVAASLIGLVVAISLKSWGVATATGVGSAVSGTAMKFILAQRDDHRRRAIQWVAAIERADCPDMQG